MTLREVRKKDGAQVQAEYPIAGLTDGWFFRQREVSPGAFLVEGTDLWGRSVSRQGGDPEQLLAECAEDARRITQNVRHVG